MVKIKLSSNKTFHVKDLIIEDDYATISGDKTIVEASLVMKEKEIPDLVVLDKDNQVLGVIADHDIVITAVATGKDPKTTKVVESMYKIDPVSLDTPVEEAFQRMQALKVTTVPVVENGSLKGVVTITDCWGYIPEKYDDYKGLLTVKDPKFANYWWSILFTVLYFFLGVISPALGIAGFLTSTYVVSTNVNPTVTYYLFDAHGGGYFIRYLDFGGNNLLWTIITFYSLIFVILGIVSSVLILQWAYGDYKMIRSNQDWPKVGFIIGIINMAIIWLLFTMMYFIGVDRAGSTGFDFFGFILSLLSIIFLILAVFRDFVFKGSEVSN